MRLAKTRPLALLAIAGLGAFLCGRATTAQYAGLSTEAQERLRSTIRLGSLEDDMRQLPAGWQIGQSVGIDDHRGNPDALPDDSVVNPDAGPDLNGSIADALDLGDARLLYRVTGGLAAMFNELRIDADGTATVTWDRLARGDEGGSLSVQLPADQIQALKALFTMLEFQTLPGEFEPEGNVNDSLDYLVAARFGNGDVKSVMSHTGAVEDPRFTAIRFVLDSLFDRLRTTDLLQVSRRFPDEPDLDRRLTLGPHGILSAAAARSELPQLQVSVDEVRQIRAAMAAIDFEDLPVLIGEPPPRSPMLVIKVNFSGRLKTVAFSPEDDDPRVPALMKVVHLIEAARDAHS